MILPIQNPDGREADTRRNANGFDMNRDWFARTQPETDGKIEVLRQYPPMLYIDAHEFGLSNYFFPPNADPEYHEIPDTAHDWINDLYSPAIAGEFDREEIKFFHGAPYDFFATIFGDTVPTRGFHAAGMTFEKANFEAISVRFHEHFTSMWASLAAGARPDRSCAAGTTRTWRPTRRASTAGSSPTRSSSRAHALPAGARRRPSAHYFLLPMPTRAFELQLLVRRLQRMDVSVYQLNAPLTVPTSILYGDPAQRDAPGRDVLDPDGPGPEALDPGDAERGHRTSRST